MIAMRQRARVTLATALAMGPASVLALAGGAKLADPLPFADFLRETVHVHFPGVISLARAVGFAEVLLAVTIVLSLNRSRIPSMAATGLLSSFAGLLIRLLLTEEDAATCGCFGSVFNPMEAWPPWWQVALNVALAAMLIVHCALFPAAPGRSATSPAA